MSQTVYEWELYCTTEGAYKNTFSVVEPTTCPTNSAHTISTDPGPRVIDEISSQQFKLIEQDGVTQGIYKFRGSKQNIPSQTPGTVNTFTHQWSYPITLLNGWFISTDDMVGDIVECTVAENTIIGAITQPVYVGNTVISVTPTVTKNLYEGYYVNITDGVNLSNLGECINIDSGNSTITVSTPSTNNFSPLSPTYVRMTVGVIDNFQIPVGKQRYAFAEKKVGGKYIPSDIPIHIKYTNNTGNAKVYAYNMEYLY